MNTVEIVFPGDYRITIEYRDLFSNNIYYKFGVSDTKHIVVYKKDIWHVTFMTDKSKEEK